MNVRIFWVRAMKCMCAQTRPRFILSSEGVFGGMEFEPMLTPREKSPLPEHVPRGGSNPRLIHMNNTAMYVSHVFLRLSFSDWDDMSHASHLLSVSVSYKENKNHVVYLSVRGRLSSFFITLWVTVRILIFPIVRYVCVCHMSIYCELGVVHNICVALRGCESLLTCVLPVHVSYW